MKTSFTISEDKSKLDVAFIQSELSASYWAKNIPLSVVEKSIAHSICFGVYSTDRQIGFARVITDQATFAYLCDVIINENFRKQGAGKLLMKYIMNHPALQGLRRFSLATLDAHSLYTQYGFTPLQNPYRMMEITKHGIYDAPAMLL